MIQISPGNEAAPRSQEQTARGQGGSVQTTGISGFASGNAAPIHTITNAVRQSAISSRGHDAPGQLEGR